MNYINDDYFLGHLLKRARATNQNRLEVDIVNNIAKPEELLTEPVRSSIDSWNKRFPELVESSGSTMEFVKEATMVVEFDLRIQRAYAGNNSLLESPFYCEISIVDDRGKVYKHRHEGWWFPES
ncbi:hypothetical protein H7F15_19075 [Pontibacter sp. Tf4]|uniref:hypothetical protein n=1 Tax=Pontibacter sp. Tf4 TaxID=2761620 RepID=UPI00162AA797|nr:hypothetical protein [Pontibacter sp. Tf4]MBB6613150.1 hypothetical protein [Pontibacter sp. Tf4]